MAKFKRIGVLTSGGDAPGMNAAVRAVTRLALYKGVEVYGIYNGYQGLIDGDIKPLGARDVSYIINRGGTMLYTARCPEFKTKEGVEKAAAKAREFGLDGIVTIGGDGTFRGAVDLTDAGIPCIGIPGTIDNDIASTEMTIGFDTAMNTVVDLVDKLRDTSESHSRCTIVEVMGRDAGFIGLYTAISTGAEATLIPEVHTDVDDLCNYLVSERRKNKTSGIIIVAEGEDLGSAEEVAKKVKAKLPDYETRVTTLGHIQRGGSPTCSDRVLASILGNRAVEALLDGQSGVMVGQINGEIVYTPFVEACAKHNQINKLWYEIAHILAL